MRCTGGTQRQVENCRRGRPVTLFFAVLMILIPLLPLFPRLRPLLMRDVRLPEASSFARTITVAQIGVMPLDAMACVRSGNTGWPQAKTMVEVVRAGSEALCTTGSHASRVMLRDRPRDP